jgi:hypothetical protein
VARVLIDEERFFAWVKHDKGLLVQLNEDRRIPSLLTVKQFSEKHPAFPEGGLRHRIFNATTNGLDDYDAIVRNGGKQ